MKWSVEDIKKAIDDVDKLLRPYVIFVNPSRVEEFEAAVGDLVVIKAGPVPIDTAYAFTREEWEKIEKGEYFGEDFGYYPIQE